MFGKNRIKGGSATSKDEWLDGVKQLKMETNWHCTLRMFKQHTCRSNQGQVHSSGDCSNGGSRFFLSKNGDFPLPLCHDGSTDVYFGWVQTVLKNVRVFDGLWAQYSFYSPEDRRGLETKKCSVFDLKMTIGSSSWFITLRLLYQNGSLQLHFVVGEWSFRCFRFNFPISRFLISTVPFAPLGSTFFNTGALCSPMPLRKARGA